MLRTMVQAYRYERNESIHRDLKIDTVVEEIRRHSQKYETRLSKHPNPSAIQLLDNSNEIRRLKRFKSADLPVRSN